MSNALAAARAYSTNRPHTKSYRDQEYDVFLDVTRDLKRLKAETAPSFPKLVDALNRNERLWTEIGVQVADNANELPKELRASLFYMAEFVSHQTGRLLKNEGDLESLIDVNIAVLRGLKGNLKGEV